MKSAHLGQGESAVLHRRNMGFGDKEQRQEQSSEFQGSGNHKWHDITETIVQQTAEVGTDNSAYGRTAVNDPDPLGTPVLRSQVADAANDCRD